MRRRRPRDWRQALSFVPNAADRVIARRGKIEIILVIHRLDSRKRRSRAYLVTWWFRKHLFYGKLHDPTDTSEKIDYHVFIARKNDMAIGALLVSHPLFGSTLLRWKQASGHTPVARQPKKKPIWKVAFVGVLETRRRKGIARMLINEAARYFECEIQDFGWTLPFEPDGAALVRKLCPRFFWSA